MKLPPVLILALWLAALLALPLTPARAAPPGEGVPSCADPRLEVRLFAASPDIVHPVGAAFDSRGRLLVIESHTHFRPAGYKGPKHDRIRVLEDTDGDGRADRFSTFYEGTTATMSIAAHPDGSVYVATRNEILRLRDTKGDGKADEVRRIAFLETRGAYPHNGLAGLCFDSRGDLLFGLGENLGADYKLSGSDGSSHSGGGEGGGVFWCSAQGKHLRRVATGFWNPFGVCRDIYGRVYAVDNDPDAMPPCRMVQVVEGGDYGYQFRYGRAGRHPFQSWDGQLPGTLPMASGVGEAPCQVLSYESDGLPRDYLGQLLVASWADHRLERYELKDRGASAEASRKPFVQGGADFRPVGVAVAPDGSLFVTDWVKADYTLHGKGAVWQVRARKPEMVERPKDPKEALLSTHRPLREWAARELAKKDPDFLRSRLSQKDERVRAAILTALVDAGEKIDLLGVAERDPVVPLRALAVRSLAVRSEDARAFAEPGQPPAVRLEAVASLKDKSDLPLLMKLLTDADPFLRSAAVRQLGRSAFLKDLDSSAFFDPRKRVGLLLAWRASGSPGATEKAAGFLDDGDEDVRFLTYKWVSDEKLTAYRSRLAADLKGGKLNVRLYLACATALARVDGREVSESQLASYFFDRLKEPGPAAVRVLALQMIPASSPKLTPEFLGGLLADPEKAVQVEAVRALVESPSPKKVALLQDAVGNEKLAEPARAQAVLGLTGQEQVERLLHLAMKDSPAVRDEALRSLVGLKLSAGQKTELEGLAKKVPGTAALVARVLGQPFAKDRPAPTDLSAWLKKLAGPADAGAGKRIFAHPKLTGCYRCHRVEGRGADIGPDLSAVGRNPRRHIVESILQPSALVAPHYQAWIIETHDGKVRTGMLVKTDLDNYTYLAATGDLFKVNTRDVAESRPATKSIMPDGLADLLTEQELRDLLAYLESRR